jgi:GTPase SAR1 family protein
MNNLKNVNIIVYGHAGSGKTIFLANYINHFNSTYDTIIVVSDSVNEPIHQNLKQRFHNTITLCTFEEFEAFDKIPNGLLVFDNCYHEHPDIRNYAKSYTCIFLIQSHRHIEPLSESVHHIVKCEYNLSKFKYYIMNIDDIITYNDLFK